MAARGERVTGRRKHERFMNRLSLANKQQRRIFLELLPLRKKIPSEPEVRVNFSSAGQILGNTNESFVLTEKTHNGVC